MPDTRPLPLADPAPRPSQPTRLGSASTGGRPPRRPSRGRDLALVVTAAVVFAATLVAAGWAGVTISGSRGNGSGAVVGSSHVGGAGVTSGDLVGGPVRDQAATGLAGGLAPDGTTAFDVDVPAVAGLDPRLLDALQRAATDASAEGVEVVVNSGWRSAAYQQQLLDDAVATYGSAREAARWVALPTTSAHVSGDAVDIGSWDATTWFSERGADYDLCQIYENESWHYELRDGAATDGCPPMYRDAGEDPRMQQ